MKDIKGKYGFIRCLIPSAILVLVFALITFISICIKAGKFDELQKAYNEYFDILENGSDDALWEDGGNMNLCANHFCYYKAQIKETYHRKGWTCLDWIHKNLLIEVPNDYMARQEAIRSGAQKALEIFESDKNLSLIRRCIGIISKDERDSIYADTILGYYTKLKDAIEEDDLVTMRLYKNYNLYLDAFKQCADKLKNADMGLFSIPDRL
jgi:hypothetical protein